MGEVHGVEHLQEQLQPGAQRGRAPLHESAQVLALDVFEGQEPETFG
jgi:hypothetical protein